MSDRMVLFIDAQNIYKGARTAFFDIHDLHTCGQFDPLRLGKLVCSKQPFSRGKHTRTLAEVRVYWGATEFQERSQDIRSSQEAECSLA